MRKNDNQKKKNQKKKNQKKKKKKKIQTKKNTLFQKSQKWSLGLLEAVLRPYDEIKKCSDCHPESSHMNKNSSRRTPRPKKLIFVIFHLFSERGRKIQKGVGRSKKG